jgi:hypothetical protein
VVFEKLRNEAVVAGKKLVEAVADKRMGHPAQASLSIRPLAMVNRFY